MLIFIGLINMTILLYILYRLLKDSKIKKKPILKPILKPIFEPIKKPILEPILKSIKKSIKKKPIKKIKETILIIPKKKKPILKPIKKKPTEKKPVRKKPTLDKFGYKRGDNKKLIHRNVAYKRIYLKNRKKYPLTFNKYVVHHIDTNKLNNKMRNLYICTKKEHGKIHDEQIKRRGKMKNSHVIDTFLYVNNEKHLRGKNE